MWMFAVRPSTGGEQLRLRDYWMLQMKKPHEPTIVPVPDEDFEWLLKLMGQPPEPNHALRELLSATVTTFYLPEGPIKIGCAACGKLWKECSCAGR